MKNLRFVKILAAAVLCLAAVFVCGCGDVSSAGKTSGEDSSGINAASGETEKSGEASSTSAGTTAETAPQSSRETAAETEVPKSAVSFNPVVDFTVYSGNMTEALIEDAAAFAEDMGLQKSIGEFALVSASRLSFEGGETLYADSVKYESASGGEIVVRARDSIAEAGHGFYLSAASHEPTDVNGGQVALYSYGDRYLAFYNADDRSFAVLARGVGAEEFLGVLAEICTDAPYAVQFGKAAESLTVNKLEAYAFVEYLAVYESAEDYAFLCDEAGLHREIPGFALSGGQRVFTAEGESEADELRELKLEYTAESGGKAEITVCAAPGKIPFRDQLLVSAQPEVSVLGEVCAAVYEYNGIYCARLYGGGIYTDVCAQGVTLEELETLLGALCR